MATRIIILSLLIAIYQLANSQGNYQLDTNGLMDLYESGATEFEMFDIDEDGDLDIISVGDHMNPGYTNEQGLIVFRNNGSGNAWLKIMNGIFGYGGIAVGDVNNDGYYDVAYGVHHNYGGSSDLGDQRLEVVLGNGTGYSWIPWDDNLAQQGQTWGMFDCDFADIDNDGLLDLGANSFGSPDGVWIYKNNGNGFWSVMSGALTGNSSNDFSFGDFNNDGYVDFITNNQKFNNQTGNIWSGDGSGNFYSMNIGLPFSYPSNYGFKFDIADIDKDGAKEVVFTLNGGLAIYKYDTIQNIWAAISSGLPTTGGYTHLAIGDLTGDGYQDIAGVKSNKIVIFERLTSGFWTATDSINTGSTTIYDIKIGDLDKNGKADIAFWGKINGVNMLRVYKNTQIVNQLNINPVFPIGKEILCGNSAQFVKWNRSVPQNNSSTVKIELSENGKNGLFTTVKSVISNANTYQWITPKTTSTDCYLRYIISSNGNSDTAYTDTAFTIQPCVRKPIITSQITGNKNLCNPFDTTTLQIDSVYGATGYYWTYPQGWQATAIGTKITLITDNNSGLVSVYAYTNYDTSAAKTIQVNIIQIDTNVIATDSSLTAIEGIPASYQWIECLSQQPIAGATNQTFKPMQGGLYAVEITKNGCIKKSNCHKLTTHLFEIEADKASISPNPTNGIININHQETIKRIIIKSMEGQTIYFSNPNQKNSQIDISHFSTGIYIIQLETENYFNQFKIIKTEN